jgi:hypothetical protein
LEIQIQAEREEGLTSLFQQVLEVSKLLRRKLGICDRDSALFT